MYFLLMICVQYRTYLRGCRLERVNDEGELQAYAVGSLDSSDVWHSRLGHPSIKVL